MKNTILVITLVFLVIGSFTVFAGPAIRSGGGYWLNTAAGLVFDGDVNITGNIISSEPTSDEHVATRGYVLANSGGDGLAAQSMSANAGMYNNIIPSEDEFSHSSAFTEVCFKNGNVYNDQHSSGGNTSGGNCVGGDIGWIIEQGERSSQYWENARAECLKYGMRLPEPFEFKYSCKNAGTFGLSSMTGNWEWASNFALPMYSSYDGVAAAIFGNGGCNYGTWHWVGYGDGSETSGAFRCVR